MAGASPAIVEGSFVRDTSDGRTYRVAGGAPLYVMNWSAFGGPQPSVDVAHSVITGMRPYPLNGTYLEGSSTGRIYVIAGGAPILLTSS